MYETNKIHSIIFLVCITLACISTAFAKTPDSKPLSKKVEVTKTWATKTGVLVSLPNGKETKGTWSQVNIWTCDAKCKIETLTKIGIRNEIAEALVNTCKKQDIAVVNCIKLWASIVMAESWWGNQCYKNWCFGILAKWVNYKTIEEWVEDWVKRFWKFWLNQKNPNSFYSNSPDWKPKTRYCLSENQPDGTVLPYCKNWHKHSWNTFNKLNNF